MYGVKWEWGGEEIAEEPSVLEVFLLFFRALHGENRRIGNSLADLAVAVFCFFALVVFSASIECLGYSERDVCGITDKIDDAFPSVKGWLSDWSTRQQSGQQADCVSLQRHGHVNRIHRTKHMETQTEPAITTHSFSSVQSQNLENCTVPHTQDTPTTHESDAGEAIRDASKESAAATELNNVSLQPCALSLSI